MNVPLTRKKLNSNRLQKKIETAWSIIRQSKNYREWINADVGCYLLQVQIKTIIGLLMTASIDKPLICVYYEKDFDVLFSTMLCLNKNVMQQKCIDDTLLNDLIKEKEFLFCKLNKVLYVVQ